LIQNYKNFFLLVKTPAFRKETIIVSKYLIVGTIASLIQFGTFYLLLRSLGTKWYLVSSTIAFIIAVVISFTLQKYWTFRDKNNSVIRKQFTVFFLVGVNNLFLNVVFMYILVNLLNRHSLAQAITLVFLAVLSFVLNRTITFGNIQHNESVNNNRNLSA